ncbi:lactoylglutathione lyase [Rhodococcus oxybenzonivorans]|uniref:Lactoylglutathione lyase n=1 Tax=Rhodococcus oxybenzonivorans TaxID=1990687 RepID=A0A2S2BSB5_9NOCA|nr:VOC family protein [Rhodococcus oxybenzonivorans]AWK71526.1 lactoylglutathione lyase [Rhodococcus oxybenzonivorans]
MSLVTGPIFQVCWVVEDLATAERHFADQFGVAKWLRLPNVHSGPDHCTYRGEPADYVVHVSLGYAGGQQLELIEPVSGRNLYVEQLERSGPGVHHVAWVPDDFEATLAEAARRGLPVVQQGRFEGVGMEFAYLEGGRLGGYVELMKLSEEMRAMFDSLVPE